MFNIGSLEHVTVYGLGFKAKSVLFSRYLICRGLVESLLVLFHLKIWNSRILSKQIGKPNAVPVQSPSDFLEMDP